MSTKDRHREHHAVTVSTKLAVHVLIRSDVYILKFSDGEHHDGRTRTVLDRCCRWSQVVVQVKRL